jgi:hypothetical protein
MRWLHPVNWKWQWSLVVLLLSLGGLAMIEPESAEAAKSMATISAMLGVGWFIWHLMNYEG